MATFKDLTPRQQEEFHMKVLELCRNFVHKMQPKYYYQYKGDPEDLAMECYTRFFEPAKDAYSHDKNGNIIYINKETGEQVDKDDPMATPKIYRKSKNAGKSMADIYDPEKLGGADWKADDDKKLAAFVQNFVYHRLIDFSKEDQIDTISLKETNEGEDDKSLTWERLKTEIVEELPQEYSDDDILEMRDRFDELPLEDKKKLKEWFEHNYQKEGMMSAESFDIMLDILSGEMTEPEIKKVTVSNGKPAPQAVKEIVKRLGATANISNGSDRRLRIWFNEDKDRASYHEDELKPYLNDIEKAGYKFQKFSGHGAYFLPTEAPSYRESKGGKAASDDVVKAVESVTSNPVEVVKAKGVTRLRIPTEGADKDAIAKAVEPLGFKYYTTARGNYYFDKPLTSDSAEAGFLQTLRDYGMTLNQILKAYDSYASPEDRVAFLTSYSELHDMADPLDNTLEDYIFSNGVQGLSLLQELDQYLSTDECLAFVEDCKLKYNLGKIE